MNRFLAVVAVVVICGPAGSVTSRAGGLVPDTGSCTDDAGGCPRGPGACHARRCGPGRQGACGAATCCPFGRGAGCHGRCCRAPCCHGLCDGCGHGCHEDTYDKRYFLRSQGKSWHSAWYDPAEGRPIALVVPPTAEFQSQYGWGVPSSRVAPIYHQFRRPYPGPGAVGGGGGLLPAPNQPGDTVQFGVNAVRGPWGSY